MAIVALLLVLLLFVSGLAVTTHLWWGDSFGAWWRTRGSSLAAELRASLESRWRSLRARSAGRTTAATRLERFAEQQSMEIEPINPFGAASELPRRSLRALASRPQTVSEDPLPASADWALVKIDSAMTGRILGATARAGDVWLNLTRVDAWQSMRQRRTFLVGELRRHPEWTDEDIYEIGVALAIWNDASAFAANRARNRQRVRRLRLATARLGDHAAA